MSNMFKRFRTDIDWPLLNTIKSKFNFTVIRDNSPLVGPLRPIPNDIHLKPRYKFDWTTCHDPRVLDPLGGKLPVTSLWFHTDSERNFEKRKNKAPYGHWLKSSGWINEDGSPVEIVYHINDQGFRHDGTVDDVTSQTGGVIYIGDSNVMAMGVQLEKSWTYLAHYECEKTKDLPYINMGMHGKGIDTYWRLLRFYIEKVKPKYVVMCYPWQYNRTEYYDDVKEHWVSLTTNKLLREYAKDDKLEKIPMHGQREIWNLFHTSAAYVRWYKNLDAIKWMCHQHGAQLLAVEEYSEDEKRASIVSQFDTTFKEDDVGRDCAHRGVKNHRNNGTALKELMDYVFTV